MGKSLFLETEASGTPVVGRPGENGMGTTLQGYIEMSNVNVMQEMINLIIGQRAYEINTKAIQAADEMLQMATNIRR
jgi:flagellar basal-body rod protein FlgG